MTEKEKIVIFDWGGVIESHTPGQYNQESAVNDLIMELNPNCVSDNIFRDYCLCSYDSNNIKISAFNSKENIVNWYKIICNKFNLSCSFEEFCKTYVEEHDKIEYYKEVVEFAHSLKKYCNIGILSNLITLDRQRIDKQVNLSKFDYVWLSFEIGYAKPSVEVYEIVEKDFDSKSILFIDDNVDNIEMAKLRGWNTCNAYGYELDKIKQAVDEFLK